MSDGTLIFIHGADGYADDTPLARDLADARGLRLRMPRLPEDDMSSASWTREIGAVVAGARPDDLIVGHSFGASMLVPVLGELRRPLRRAVLLAPPDWSPAGWDVPDYVYAGPEPTVPMTIHHCRDDDVVPFFHLWLWSERLPAADIHGHVRGGHQFDGLIEELLHHL